MGSMIGDVTNFCCSCAEKETLTGGLRLPKTVNSDMLGDMHDYEYVLLATDSNVDYKY